MSGSEGAGFRQRSPATRHLLLEKDRTTAMDLSPTHAMPMQPMPMHEHRSGALARTLLIGLIAFLTVIDLFGTQAILPALTKAYRVTPAAMGFAVNATTLGMAVAGLGVAYFSRSIDRRRGILVALTVLALPTALLAVAPNLAAFTALRVGQGLSVHGRGFHADPRLPRRALQHERRRRGICGLYHRQRRQQPVRAPPGGGARRSSRTAIHLSGARGAEPSRRWVRLVRLDARPLHAGAWPRTALALVDLGRAPEKPAAATELRHRVLHSVRLHRHVHLRQLRAGARTAWSWPDGARVRVPRIRAIAHDDPARRPRCAGVRDAAGLGGRLRRRGRRPAAAAGAEPACGSHRADAHRDRHLLRSGHRNRLREPNRHHGPRFGQRTLSRLVLLRRPYRQRCARTGLRSLGLDGVRGRRRCRARRGGAPRDPAEDPDGDCLIIAALYRNGRKTAFPLRLSPSHDEVAAEPREMTMSTKTANRRPT